jgi:hypothetical protein
MRFLALLLILCALTSCSHMVRVQPFEREKLAQRKMRMPASALDSHFDNHVYFSKEASRGGEGTGGGGCGCN